MIFNHFIGGGKRTATVAVYGAPSEAIKLTNSKGNVYEVTTNAHGIGDTLEIPVGNYLVTGTVSCEVLTTGRNVEVTKNTTEVTAYPSGAIFWFGNGDTDGDSLYTGNYVHESGLIPSGTSGSGGYTAMDNGADYVGAKASVPTSSGSTYGGTTYSPGFSLSGFSYVNIYANCNVTNLTRFGVFHYAKPWATDMYVTPTQTSDQFYSMAIPSTMTEGLLAVSVVNCQRYANGVAHLKAAWRDNTDTIPKGELPTSTNSINVDTQTFRYGTSCASYWGQSMAYGEENCFGSSGEGYNIALINLGSFAFPDGTKSTKLQLSFYGYRSSQQNYCWAICTSNANMALYGSGGDAGVVGEFDGDDTQIAMGTNSLEAFSSSSYTTMTLDFATDAIPSGTQLWLYLWPSDQGTKGVSHITRYLTATAYYTYGV